MIDLIIVVVGVLAITIGVLVARGMWLIGQGTDAEFEARSRSTDIPFGGTGFALLDSLRTGDLPIISRIEKLLGREVRDRTARCRSCRNVWIHPGNGGTPVCPECGCEEVKLT